MSREASIDAVQRTGVGLQTRIALAFCGLLLLFGVGAVILEWQADRRQARAHALAIVEERAAILATQAADALRLADGATLETLALAMAGRSAAMGVRVAGADGAPILTDAPDPRARALLERLAAARPDRVVSVFTPEIVAASAPVRLDGAFVGVIAVAAERAPLEAGQGGSAGRLALLMLGVLALAAPAAMWLGARALAPLGPVVAFLDGLNEKQLADRLPSKDALARGEFGELAAACNRMAERLQQSYRRLQRMAYSDTATGLPNHERFARDVTDVLATRQDDVGALFVVRLDRLERIFDAIGQDAGDELLTRIVGRLTAAVRAIDRMVRTETCAERPSQLARLRGGDFGVLAPRLRGPEDAARYAQLLASALNQPFDWRENKLVLGAVIGAAILPQDGPDADTAIRHAMLAMAAAKTDTGRMKFFTKALDREANAQLALEREMRAALEQNEFRAYFQPKIDLMTGRVIGAEALARWIKPDRTMVSPGRFIPAAEENGLIGSISDVIMRDACWKAASWAREGFPLSVAINISPLQFADERFTDKILRIMAEAGVSPNRVELEITESVALENPERALRLLEPLRAEGVKVSLDDFGCGHSSLASLTRLPFDIIKIDQQFVRALAKDRHAPAIIEMILAMAASLDYTVVAEGVETEHEAEFLRRRGCQIGQGFLYGAAMPPAEFLRFNVDRAAALNDLRAAKAV
ncbi:MAG: bifunctional diguanylate cyclase/phosphodiesterase [Hyphomonadaceae bacterium]|nr:bifunctional diguanylate cyclase/phosphodiesterase [Hyphomonadaceae bacterium]